MAPLNLDRPPIHAPKQATFNDGTPSIYTELGGMWKSLYIGGHAPYIYRSRRCVEIVFTLHTYMHGSIVPSYLSLFKHMHGSLVLSPHATSIDCPLQNVFSRECVLYSTYMVVWTNYHSHTPTHRHRSAVKRSEGRRRDVVLETLQGLCLSLSLSLSLSLCVCVCV